MVVRMDNAASVAYANCGAGRSAPLTVLARSITHRELSMPLAIAALYLLGVRNSVAGAWLASYCEQGGAIRTRAVSCSRSSAGQQ